MLKGEMPPVGFLEEARLGVGVLWDERCRQRDGAGRQNGAS